MLPSIKFRPLGGVQEIGSNMMLVESEKCRFIIDAGILFPEDEWLGIEAMVPDISFLKEGPPDFLFITHGHEDHIGAICYFLKQFPLVPIYCSPFTEILICLKCREENLLPLIKSYNENSVITENDITIHPIHVNHSIPETFGVFIEHKNLGAFYASDFKIDPKSKKEAIFNFAKLKTLMAKKSKILFLIDSTNILSPGKTSSEEDLVAGLETLISSSVSRIFISLFASNIHRLQSIVDLCVKTDRTIGIMGRSIQKYVKAATETGHLKIPNGFLVEAHELKNEKNICLLVSGCQGDFKSALNRLAKNESRDFKLGKEDLVVFSSKIIPGNENKVYRIYNLLSENLVPFVHAKEYLIHASGHPSQEDLHLLLREVTPNFYLPIHGESYFLRKHVEFIKTHYPKIDPSFLLNWSIAEFRETGIEIEKKEIIKPLALGEKQMPLTVEVLRERKKMAATGVLVVLVNTKTRSVKLISYGLPSEFQEHFPAMEQGLKKMLPKSLSEDSQDSEPMRLWARNYCYAQLKIKPYTSVKVLSA